MSTDAFGSLTLLLGLAFFVAYAASLVLLYYDAQARGKTGCMWSLIVFFTWPFGLLAYLLLRDQKVVL